MRSAVTNKIEFRVHDLQSIFITRAPLDTSRDTEWATLAEKCSIDLLTSFLALLGQREELIY